MFRLRRSSCKARHNDRESKINCVAKEVCLSVIGITNREESPLISTRHAHAVGMALSGSHLRSVASHDLSTLAMMGN